MKATKVVVRQRVEEVYKLRLGGAEFSDIVQFASAPEQAWGVSERQLWNYVRAADRLVTERFDAKAGHLLNRHILQRRTLFAHCMSSGDYRTALAVLRDEAELEGLTRQREADEAKIAGLEALVAALVKQVAGTNGGAHGLQPLWQISEHRTPGACAGGDPPAAGAGPPPVGEVSSGPVTDHDDGGDGDGAGRLADPCPPVLPLFKDPR
jgi:hypothetical protein